MRKVELYLVHSDRSVKKHPAKVNLPDYLDTKTGRWLFRPGNIFDANPLAEFESWADFLGWKPLVGPPAKPAALAIDGDMMPQAPVAMSDQELADMLTRTPVAAAQDLMTTVGTMDSKQSALTWGLAGILGACAVAIMVIIMIAAIAFLSRGDDAPAPAERPPSMETPAPAGTPWPWPTQPVPQPTAVPQAQPMRRRQARLGLAFRLARRRMRRMSRSAGAKQTPKSAAAVSQPRRKEKWARLLVYDAALPDKPYIVGLPRRELRRHFDDLHELKETAGRSSMWVCRRNGDAIKPIPIERDQRSHVTPEFLGEVRQWHRKHAKQQAKLLIYDDALPEQPYMATLPRYELRSRFGGSHELKTGRSSMWACRRNGDEFTPIPIERDQRTTRTPKFVLEYMKLRADKLILGRPRGKAEKALMMGAAVAIVITCVAGLILVIALAG